MNIILQSVSGMTYWWPSAYKDSRMLYDFTILRDEEPSLWKFNFEPSFVDEGTIKLVRSWGNWVPCDVMVYERGSMAHDKSWNGFTDIEWFHGIVKSCNDQHISTEYNDGGVSAIVSLPVSIPECLQDNMIGREVSYVVRIYHTAAKWSRQ